MIGIYKITNKINNKCYIGQSIDINRRWLEHKNPNNWDRKSILYDAFKKYDIENFSFEIIEECAQEELNEKEKYWIQYYNSYYNGYNSTLGGDGTFLYDYKKLVDLYLIHKSTKKVAEIADCHTHTVENALKTFNINAEGKKEKRPIKQIDPNTLKVINIYDSIGEAAKALGKKSNGQISNALNGITNSAYGYLWKDIDFDETTLKPIKIKKYKKEICQIDKDTNKIIKVYESAQAACKELGISASNLSKVLSKERNTAGGFKWKYTEDL